MVCDTVNPNLRDASCCRVEVVKGGAGCFFSGFTEMSLTENDALAQSLRNCLAASRSDRRRCSSAFTTLPSGVENWAVTRKYGSLLKFLISFSRSTIKRTATLCTRPAESDGLILRHSTGDSSKPTMRSSTRRACWASTRLRSMLRGVSMAWRMASLVIS